LLFIQVLKKSTVHRRPISSSSSSSSSDEDSKAEVILSIVECQSAHKAPQQKRATASHAAAGVDGMCLFYIFRIWLTRKNYLFPRKWIVIL
jgi:hypothetical protein